MSYNSNLTLGFENVPLNWNHNSTPGKLQQLTFPTPPGMEGWQPLNLPKEQSPDQTIQLLNDRLTTLKSGDEASTILTANDETPGGAIHFPSGFRDSGISEIDRNRHLESTKTKQPQEFTPKRRRGGRSFRRLIDKFKGFYEPAKHGTPVARFGKGVALTLGAGFYVGAQITSIAAPIVMAASGGVVGGTFGGPVGGIIGVVGGSFVGAMIGFVGTRVLGSIGMGLMRLGGKTQFKGNSIRSVAEIWEHRENKKMASRSWNLGTAIFRIPEQAVKRWRSK